MLFMLLLLRDDDHDEGKDDVVNAAYDDDDGDDDGKNGEVTNRFGDNDEVQNIPSQRKLQCVFKH